MAWEILLDLLILLSAALLLGTAAELLGQNAVLGYLLAGPLVGPHVLGFVAERDRVAMIAELGVALLLFTIGLEFSRRRLRRMGRVALIGGTVQVVVTLVAAALFAAMAALPWRAAVAVAAAVALSSTAGVVRVLSDRGAADSLYGRNAIGILLMQDVAVIPLMLLLVTLTGGTTPGGALMALCRSILLAGAMIAVFVLALNVVAPRLLNLEQWARNRELPILLAIIAALGSAMAAHAASLSPAVGAFIAGVLLGESPLAAQIRADVASLRTLLVTIFFASIGMLGDPVWMLDHWRLLGAVVAMIVVGKPLIVWPIVRRLGYPHGLALASGVCLAQVGEFSFVLADEARRAALIDLDVFRLLVSATIVTLFLTPALVAAAPRLAGALERWRRGTAPGPEGTAAPAAHDIMIVGFGPAGQAVAHHLYRLHRDRIMVIELNPRNAVVARDLGLAVTIGDARHADVIEHAGLRRCRVLAITLPDGDDVRRIVHVCRRLAPDVAIIARARYHIRRWEIEFAGAHETIDEEENLGLRVAASVRKYLPVEDAAPQPPPASQ